MQIFMVRSKPHNIERIDVFLNDNIIAIGWTETGDLTSATKEDIRQVLKSLGYEGQSLLTNLGMINAFVNTMKEGDIVLVREGKVVHIGKVGPYEWRKEYIDKHMAHTRPVKWLAHVPFAELNAQMQSLLRNMRTICRYKGNFAESGLDRYISQSLTESQPGLPTEDKEALIANTIDVLKELMNHAEDESVRLEAAKELLKHLKTV
jgi:predicted Mrr-cat superfamily restriction endonuclease